jgi:hypothetical protein
MSLVGSVGLSSNTNGLYLGKVNLNNFDASANSIVYSTNGIDLKGNNLFNYDETTNTLTLNNDTVGTAGNAHISLNGDTGGVNKALTSNGYDGLKWVPVIDNGMRMVFYEIGEQQQTTPLIGQNIQIYNTNGDKYNYIPSLYDYVECVFNLSFDQDDVLTLVMYDSNNTQISAYNYVVSIGSQTLSVVFNPSPITNYSVNFYIQAIMTTGNVSINSNSFYSVKYQQWVNKP